MSLEQRMAYATWNRAAEHWEMDLGNGDATQGTLNSLIEALSREEWEIVSAVADQIKIQTSVITEHTTDQYVCRYAFFCKRVVSDGGGLPGS